MSNKFTIFYSWQSDLPSYETRYFIKKCIDEAIAEVKEVYAIEAERDESTFGLTGSPSIIEAIYSKIDNKIVIIQKTL